MSNNFPSLSSKNDDWEPVVDFVYLLKHESRPELSPASSPTYWFWFELYPGREVGRTDIISSL